MRIETDVSRHGEGSASDRARTHARAVRRFGRGPRAAVSERDRQRMGHGGVRHASPRDAHALGPRAAAVGRQGGRTVEIQRLIGRSLRQRDRAPRAGRADDHARLRRPAGGRRNAHRRRSPGPALPSTWPPPGWSARAGSPAGRCGKASPPCRWESAPASPVLDLAYEEDSEAEVDFNVVGTVSGNFVEIQGTAERRPFSEQRLQELLGLARQGLKKLRDLQTEALAPHVAGIDFT